MHVKVYMRAPGFLRDSTVPGTIEIRALPISMNHGSLNFHSGGEGQGGERYYFLPDAKLRVEFFPFGLTPPPGSSQTFAANPAFSSLNLPRKLQYFTSYTDW